MFASADDISKKSRESLDCRSLVFVALETTANELFFPYHKGSTCATSDFYAGQGEKDKKVFPSVRGIETALKAVEILFCSDCGVRDLTS